MVPKDIESLEGKIDGYFHKFDYSKFTLKKNPLFFQNNLINLENNFQEIQNCLDNKIPFYVVSGINPFAKPHLGYKFISQVFDYFLDEKLSRGYLIIPKKEMRLMGKVKDKQEYTMEFLNLLKNKDKVKLREDSLNGKLGEILDFMYQKYSIKKIKKIFKLEEDDKIGKYLGILYAIANYFIPNLENKTNFPTLVLANGKHKNFLMYANNLSNILNMPKISSIIMEDVPGKDGIYKMSASKRKSIISLENVEEDFLKTNTSGKMTEMEQLEKGGEPENCSSLKIGRFFNEKKILSELEASCKNGNTCSMCKKQILKGIKK